MGRKKDTPKKLQTYIKETNEDGRYCKVMHGVTLLTEAESALYTPPPECKNWLEYVRRIVRMKPWMCGCCLCENPRVGTSGLVGVLVQEHEHLDSRIFATHLCRACYDYLSTNGNYYVAFAYLVPIGLEINWSPKSCR